MKFSAVIFDLFGTLVDSYSIVEFNNLMKKMAATLAVPKMDFFRGWVKAARQSMVGKTLDPATSVKAICRDVGVTPGDNAIFTAARDRINFERSIMLNPRPDAMAVLKILKRRGYKLGLISNCTAEAPLIWQETPMAKFIETAVFSSLVKMKKPDPLIYQLMLDKLELPAEACIYVGDGSSQELSGALKVGMFPVKVRIPTAAEAPSYAIIEENWEGIMITSFYELLSFIDSHYTLDKTMIL